MDKSNSIMAEQVARAACDFEHQRTGNVPKSVTVVLSEDTVVITLHGALSPAEQALAQSPAGAAQVQEFHRQLFNDASDSMRQEIKRITGVEVRGATVEVDTTTGTGGEGAHERRFALSSPGRDTESNKVNINLAMDGDKVKEDAETLKDKTAELTGKASEVKKLGDQ